MKKGTIALVLIALATIAMTPGCAGLRPTQQQDAISLAPRGPGFVFQSIEDAAVDALAFSYLDARRSGQRDLMYGGAIVQVGGGFSYREVRTADEESAAQVRIKLGQADVARFHAYPQSEDRRLNRLNERISRKDRRSVDLIDPAHRPLFVLTPKLAVRVYRGAELPVVEVANLRRLDTTSLLAGQPSED